MQILTKTSDFEVKTVSAVSKAGIDIVDKKLVRIITFSNYNMKEIEVLRLNHLGIVDLAQEYFELKWQSATTLDNTRKPKLKMQSVV